MSAAPLVRNDRAQTAAGLGLAALILAGWIACHVYGLFYHRWTLIGILTAPLLVAVQCWLSVGLFIVAHDCMHGSLAPFRPRLNRWVGRICLLLYVGFWFDRLIAKHHDHHRYSGTSRDPDFNDEDPEHLWRWYLTFMRRYFGWSNAAFVAAVFALYAGLFRVPVANIMVFWAVPAVLSSLQLFYFGTYLPHRLENDVFADRHRARSNDYSWLVSLLTCFHFGYHHEHHLTPQVPWWKLPRQRGVSGAARPAEPQALRHSTS